MVEEILTQKQIFQSLRLTEWLAFAKTNGLIERRRDEVKKDCLAALLQTL